MTALLLSLVIALGGAQLPPDVCAQPGFDCGDFQSCTDNGDGTFSCQLPPPPPPAVVGTVDIYCNGVVCGSADLTALAIPVPAAGDTVNITAILDNSGVSVSP